ncbi:DUF805 domain-containing protein [Streptomyces filamentosus]|uniref:DUF805 domain-containing protein n=2 Tax=Streptomyces filamentosus TaxID=67294 RepID=A0ABY4UY88_STRFL|nr:MULTISPECIES: DUF805 domain-containing protein [Streptomyces]EFE76041.1 conserved hypothetical protein [Streptomyces filamentosus NRRL 15998]ESU49959.1 Inner membrane protein YhaI [Streptomyces sp. HCCB10043]EWS93038.1 hypothetical protein SSIG_03600 [Streptomyces filamentosus NRRL 11379]MYR80066.1 DUF805 domain-containing protein [Streptomyces sp. SID5466]NUV66981.1 DUF805 domain-containing protein [Streptomyces sp. CAI-121]
MNWYLAVLKNYAGFSGRARRKEYWMFTLINFVISLVLTIIGSAIGVEFISYIYSVAVIIPALAVAVRRLHDTGRSGWWLLIALVPLVGAIVLIVFLASEGKPETNEHGVNPKLAPQAI